MTSLPNPRFTSGWTDGGELAGLDAGGRLLSPELPRFKQSGPSASSVDLFARLAKTFYPADYGAIGDGVSHPLSTGFATLAAAQAVYPFATSLSQEIDFCALQACVNAAGAARGAVDMTSVTGYIFHASLDTLQLNNTNCPNGLLLRGASRGPTAIIKNNGASDTIRVTGFFFVLQDIAILDFGTATAGCGINATGTQKSYFDRIAIDGTYSGFDFSSTSVVWLRGSYVRGVGAAGFAAQLGGGQSSAGNISDCTFAQTVAKYRTGVGLRVTDGGGWLVSGCESEGFSKALQFAPTGGQLAISNKFLNCFFDDSDIAASFEAGTGSSVQRTTFVSCWFGDCIRGVWASSSNGGTVDGLLAVACEIVNNSAEGWRIDFVAGTKSCYLNSSVLAQNGTAVLVGGGVQQFGVKGCEFGPVHALNANFNNIILSAGSSDWYAIVNNTLRPPAGANLTDGGTGTNAIVKNNPGYNPVGGAAITVGASPFTYTAGHSDETIYIFGGTVSIVATGGGTVANASPATIQLGPNETVTVTYSSAPTMRKSVH